MSSFRDDATGVANGEATMEDKCKVEKRTLEGLNEESEDKIEEGIGLTSSEEDASDYEDVARIGAEEICKKIFRIEQHVYELYTKFGKWHGFGVRKGDYGKDEKGMITMRRFFCNRVGLRDEKYCNRIDKIRSHRSETRTNCQAKLSIYLDKNSTRWRVEKVVLEHNHDLTPKGMVHMIPQFRGISEVAKDHIDVLDESIPSYTWLLQNLLEVMCHKSPSVVATDGDDAMIAVWLYGDLEVADFEDEWAEAVQVYGLEDKLWAMQMYDKKEMWVNAYLKRKFCAGYRMTSRCEGINSRVKKFLTLRHSILDLVQNLEYRNNKLLAQFNSIYNMPVMISCLDPVERCATAVYTRAIFKDVKKVIDVV
ncbi:hypothetical protein Ahy_B01g054939 [Arachis hypogaea]|uniref:FAR1 domain-containing protein n=1 Tax=Arachis hypogaea TaxID=3818 RepID=A0A445AUN2_ARAHY|nr:hypothetical protein Ahy_B01g054939 [Arachis hypogaea]